MDITNDHLVAFQPRPAAVRVTIPAKTLYDLDQFQKLQRDLLDRLGCGACTSGHDIRWDFERDFVLDAQQRFVSR